MKVIALKEFTTYDASGKVQARAAGEELDVQDSTAQRLLQMKLVTVPQTRKARRKRSREE